MSVIELSDDEAALFMAFRKNQALLAALVEAGLFELRDGSMTVHVGHDGQVSLETRHLTKLVRVV